MAHVYFNGGKYYAVGGGWVGVVVNTLLHTISTPKTNDNFNKKIGNFIC